MPSRPQKYPLSKGKTLNESFLAAARGGQINRMRSYLDQGADINARDQDNLPNVGVSGHTALIWSLFHSRHKNAVFLLEQGADVTVKNNAGLTALHYASTKVLDKLVYAGVDLNARDTAGNTALIAACKANGPLHQKGHKHIERLLDLGADPTIPAADGETVAALLLQTVAKYQALAKRQHSSKYNAVQASAYQALHARVMKIAERKRQAQIEQDIKAATHMPRSVKPVPRIKFKPKP